MHKLKCMKDILMECVQKQMYNLGNADTKELGEAIDMIKDLEEAIYYATITEAMEEGSHYNYNGHSSSQYEHIPWYDTEYNKEHKVWHEDGHNGSNGSRRKYMEAKQMHHDKNIQLQELETYIKELSHEVIEMIEGSSPEEKKYLANRMQALATKIVNLEND